MPINPTRPRILCIGVDVTWWGGSRRGRSSQWETIVSATLDDPVLHPIQRVDLAGLRNPRAQLATEPNFDADGAALCKAILDTIALHPEVDHVIVCLDAPLECCYGSVQPARRKAAAKGEPTGGKHRGAERALREYMSLLDPEVRVAWNQDLCIQAGSPIPCRITRIVESLSASPVADLSPYRARGVASPRGLVEVFPSEAIWALGIVGAYGELASSTVRAYKAKESRRLPLEDPHAIARRPLEGFLLPLSAAGFPIETINAWIDQIAAKSAVLTTTLKGQVLKSKPFDDPIDSGIAFLTAVACALGQFHEWGDGTDGTIVGPGRL